MSHFSWKSIVIAVVTIVVGRLMGANLFFPAITGLITYFAISKFGNENSKRYQTTLALITGHTVWMIAGYLTISLLKPTRNIDFLLFDIAICIAFVLMLVMNPKKWVFILIFLYELVSLIINTSDALKSSSNELRALITHIIIRVGIVGSLIFAIKSDSNSIESVITEDSKKSSEKTELSEASHLMIVVCILAIFIGGVFFYLRGGSQIIEDCSMTWNGTRFVSGYPANKNNYDSIGITNTTHTIYYPKNINQEDFLKTLNSSTDEMRKICPF